MAGQIKDRLRKLARRPKQKGSNPTLQATSEDQVTPHVDASQDTNSEDATKRPSFEATRPARESSLWFEACTQVKERHSTAWDQLAPLLPNDHVSGPKSLYTEIAAESAQSIEEAKRLREERHPNSAKARKWLETCVGLINQFNGLISAGVASNPWASIAWTAVTCALPLVLLPKTENEDAMNGVHQIITLIHIYETRETMLSMSNAAEASRHLKNKAVELYVAILIFEAEILQHRSRDPAHRFFHNVLDRGRWKTYVEQLRQLDKEFTDLWDANLKMHEEQARADQANWHQEQRGNAQDRELQKLLERLDTNYYEIKRSKERHGTRIAGTCQWFLRHPNYSFWLQNTMSSILWVSAGPGCGKSTLASFLIDARHDLLVQNSHTDAIFCYYFFSVEFPEKNNATTCVRALLHQMLLQEITLKTHFDRHMKYRNKIEVLADFHTLWQIFLDCVKDVKCRQRGVICVIDALDECPLHGEPGTRDDYTRALVQLYLFEQNAQQALTNVKTVVMSRPYDTIEGSFVPLIEKFESISLRGEEESGEIQGEINLVIHVRVEEIGKHWKPRVREQLKAALCTYEHRTYLWLYLVLDFVKDNFMRKSADIAELVRNIPKTVEDRYEQILDGSSDHHRARVLLNIVLAAIRPLTVLEAWIALRAAESNDQHLGNQHYEDLLPPIEGEIDTYVTSLCGLILKVVDGHVIFLHETARSFLMSDETKPDNSVTTSAWKKSFHLEATHQTLTSACVNMFLLRELECGIRFFRMTSHSESGSYDSWFTSTNNVEAFSVGSSRMLWRAKDELTKQRLSNLHESDREATRLDIRKLKQTFNIAHGWFEAHPFFSYTMVYWLAHAKYLSGDSSPQICSRIQDLLLTESKRVESLFFHWSLSPYLLDKSLRTATDKSAVLFASTAGLYGLLEYLLRNVSDVQAFVGSDGRLPLVCAVRSKNTACVRLLLDHGASGDAPSGGSSGLKGGIGVSETNQRRAQEMVKEQWKQDCALCRLLSDICEFHTRSQYETTVILEEERYKLQSDSLLELRKVNSTRPLLSAENPAANKLLIDTETIEETHHHHISRCFDFISEPWNEGNE